MSHHTEQGTEHQPTSLTEDIQATVDSLLLFYVQVSVNLHKIQPEIVEIFPVDHLARSGQDWTVLLRIF